MLCKSVASDWSVGGIFIYEDPSDFSKQWWWHDNLKQWSPMRHPDLFPTERASKLEFLIVTGCQFEEPNEE